MGRLSSKAVWGAALALWVLIPGSTAWAKNGSGKIDKLLQEATSSGEPQQVIIRVKPGLKSSVKERLARRGKRMAEHKLINAVSARLDAQEIKALATDPDVLSVSADADVTADATTTTADYSTLTTASVLKRALGVDDWFTGSSLTIAVIDSGIQGSTDFTGRIVGFYDFANGKGGAAATPADEYGHGTHVSGLIGSSGVSSSGKYAGVAPGIKILSLRVLDKRGGGRTSDVIQALEFAVANKDKFGIKIVNLSLGHPIYESAATDPLVQAVEAAVRSGLIVIAAAGNCGTNPNTGLPGYGGIASPGNAPSAITVGAANTFGTVGRTDDRVASYSSRGPSWYDGFAKPDILAPGSSLVSNEVDGSTLAVSYPSLVVTEGSSKYLRLNGSSMATGVVSGLVAIMMEANNYGAQQRWQQTQAGLRKNLRLPFPGAPALTPNAIKAMLQYSATPIRDANGAKYNALTQGAGLANGLGAMVLAYLADTTKTAGSFWMSASSFPPSTPFDGVEQPWAQSLIWGTRSVQGTSLMDIDQAAWGDNIVWGTGDLGSRPWATVSAADDNIVWGTLFEGDNIALDTSLFYGNVELGDNIVWGTTSDWGENIVWGTDLLGVLDGDNIVWGTNLLDDLENIVWGTLDDDNLVWGTSANKVMVLGTSLDGGVQ
jgi:serine protease AprX